MNSYLGMGLLTITVVMLGLGFGQASWIYGRSDIREYDPWLLRIFGVTFSIFLIGFMAMWLNILQSLLWLITGKEIVEVKPTTILLTEKTLRWQRSQEFLLEHFSDLRVFHSSSPLLWPLEVLKEIYRPLGRNGVIAFDYGAKTYRFGLDLEQAEAKQIIRAIQDFLSRQP
jgi:hypothetical protein